MVCLLSNDNQNKNTWHVAVEVYYLIIFQESESIVESGFVDQNTN